MSWRQMSLRCISGYRGPRRLRAVWTPPIVALSPEGHEKHALDMIVLRQRIPGDADVQLRLRYVQSQRSMQPVPPGKYRRPIGVVFLPNLRVMNAVHARCHQNQAQPAFKRHGKAKVAVLKERLQLKDEFVGNEQRRRAADQHDLDCSKTGRQPDFYEMETEGRSADRERPSTWK